MLGKPTIPVVVHGGPGFGGIKDCGVPVLGKPIIPVWGQKQVDATGAVRGTALGI
jgi:hypothetical protein